jgi:hypothetical protein
MAVPPGLSENVRGNRRESGDEGLRPRDFRWSPEISPVVMKVAKTARRARWPAGLRFALLTNCSGTLQVWPWWRGGKVRYTRDLMVRRLSALALALVMVSAPVAAAVCQATCATHQAHDMSAMAGHVHAHHSQAASAPARPGLPVVAPEVCGHQSDATVAVQRIVRALDAPAVLAVQASWLPPLAAAGVSTRGTGVEHSPPGSFALITQLRV